MNALSGPRFRFTKSTQCFSNAGTAYFLAVYKVTTLYTAKKYAVPALEKHCVDFLKRNLGPDNSFMLLTQARLFDEPQLAALCLECLDKNTPEALTADGFTDIDIETLSAVLDRDSLRVKESKLFTAVLRWSEAECQRQALPVTIENKRSVL